MGRCSRFACAAAVVVLLSACTGDGGKGSTASASPEPWRGGTLRLAFVADLSSFALDWSEELDPQKEYYGASWELLRCCLLRTLFSYNGRPTSEGGAEARPDLAAGPPEISADGLTWTIRIKAGIHYAPPLQDVEIVAQDFVRALMREASPKVVPVGSYNYAFYYSVIQGFDAYRTGDADTISGLETPDEHTLVVRLTEQAGDLPNRLALAATAPIPPNPHRPGAVLGAAQGHDRGYGRFLVSSGPYMIEGSPDLDLSLPATDQQPNSGFALTEYDAKYRVLAPGSLTLVRNPSWDPRTDDLRAAYADRIEVQIRGEWDDVPLAAAAEDLVTAVDAGTVDVVLDPRHVYRASQIRRYRADPAMEGRLVTPPSNEIDYITMNLGVPPFDDRHVRKAVASAIDEAELRRTWIGDQPDFAARPSAIATHLAPDSIEGGLLSGYDPYPPSLERAKQEMARSRYDRNGDGLCDAPQCRGVLALVMDVSGSAVAEEVAKSMEAIGIDPRVELVNPSDFNARVVDERKRVPISVGFGWSYDYPNASSVFQPLFASSSIAAGGNNSSLLGATPSELRGWGYKVTTVPSVDDRIDRCMAMIGLDQTECWAGLDRYLMEDVVPWIPYVGAGQTYVVSARVATYSYSVATTGLALDRIALEPGSQ